MAPPHAFQKTTAAAFVATLVLGLARPPENAGAFAPPPPRRSSLTMFSTTRRRRPMQMPPSEGELQRDLRPRGWWGQQCRRTPVVPDRGGAADALFFRPGTGDDDAHSHHPAGAAGPVKVAAAAAAIAEPEAAPPLELEGLDPALWERARRELEAAVAARTTATATASTATAAQSRSRGGGRKKKAKNKTGGKRGDGRTPTPPTGGGGGGGKTVTILRSAVVPVTVGGVVPSGADAEGLEVVSAGVASASPAVVGSRGENKSRKEKTKRPGAAAAATAKIIAPAAVATSRRRRASQAPSSIGPGEQGTINMVPSGANSAVRTNGALSARSSSSKRGGAAAVEKDTITGAEEALPSPSPSSTSSRSRSPRVILTREEEAELLGRIRALKRSLDLRGDHEAPHHRVDGGAPPTEAEWAACHDPPLSVEDLRRIVREGREARASLLAANEGLVVQIASKYARHKSLLGSALTPQDVIQEGRMGMMEAAERFDPARSNGARFGTYAAFWVRQRILRCIANHSRAIRLPEHVHGLLHTVNRARRDMTDEIGRVPTLPELAHRLEMPVDRLRSLEESSRHVVSLEAPLNPTGSAGRGRGGSSSGARVDDDRALGDVVPSDDGPTPEDRAEWDGLRSDVRAVMVEQLRDNERDVLVLRYGLDDGDPRTLDEVARSMGVSRERARLLEARALNKLRRPGRNHRLREYVGDADGAGGEPPSPSEEDRLWFF